MSPRRPGRRSVLTAAVLALALAAGCSAAPDEAADRDVEDGGAAAEVGDTAASRGDGGVAPAQQESGDADGEAVAQAADDGTARDSGTLPADRMIARDATITVEVSDLVQGASRARAAAAAADGYVVEEDLRPPDEGSRGHATIVLSVPSAKLDQALAQLAELGDVTGRGMSSLDVTADYVDTSARIETLEASVARVRELMDRAETIADVVALESELSDREADLDALKAHAESLEGDVSRSSITVSLTQPATEEDEPVQAEGPGGFLVGLREGWDAFTSAADAGLTAVGASLPFAGAAAVLVGPVWLLVRRRRQEEVPVGPGPDRAA